VREFGDLQFTLWDRLRGCCNVNNLSLERFNLFCVYLIRGIKNFAMNGYSHSPMTETDGLPTAQSYAYFQSRSSCRAKSCVVILQDTAEWAYLILSDHGIALDRSGRSITSSLSIRHNF
jgi:hypothetical protein